MRQLSLRTLETLLSIFLFAAFLFAGCSLSNIEKTSNFQKISKEKLRALLDNPETIIIDVRIAKSWKKSDRKIRGAVHEDPFKRENSWAGKYPKDKNIVLY